MKKIYVLKGNYGYGWEDLVYYDLDEKKEARADLKSYIENEGYQAQFKLVKRRVEEIEQDDL